MRIPFFDRFVTKSKSFYEMEDIIDKTLREFLRSPWEDFRQIGEAIYADENKTKTVMEDIEHTLPVFRSMVSRIRKGEEDKTIVQETGVILPYIVTLREVILRQQPEDEEEAE